MKTYGFAVNQIKLQRAIAASKGDESKVRELYEAMGGLVQKGYKAVEQPSQDTEHFAEGFEQFIEDVREEITLSSIDGKEINLNGIKIDGDIVIKKRGRKTKNA